MHVCLVMKSVSNSEREFGFNFAPGMFVDLDRRVQGVTVRELIDEGALSSTDFEEVKDENSPAEPQGDDGDNEGQE